MSPERPYSPRCWAPRPEASRCTAVTEPAHRPDVVLEILSGTVARRRLGPPRVPAKNPASLDGLLIEDSIGGCHPGGSTLWRPTVPPTLMEESRFMSLRNVTPTVCDQCIDELKARLIEQNYLGGRLEYRFGSHVLAFPEGEYTLRAQHLRGKGHCELTVTASIRAAPPRLGTWEADWTARVDTHRDVGRLVVAEVKQARLRFLDMLRDHGEPILS